MESKKLFLAADSGGSKTEWVLLDSNGDTVAIYKTNGLGAIKEGLLPIADIVNEAYLNLKSFGEANYLYLSLGGPNVTEVENALKTVFANCKIKVEREANGNAMLKAARMLDCDAVVMCGTGSVAVGNTENGRKYCGGWGPVYGDEGSGGGLCTDALKIFLRSLDGMEEKSRLSEVFSNITKGLDLSNFNERMEAKARAVSLDRRTLASFAPKIYELAEQNDPIARQLYINAAKEIANMAFSVSDNHKNTSVLLCGGFLKDKSLLIQEIKKVFATKSDATVFYHPLFSPITAAKTAVLEMGDITTNKILFEKLLKN